MSRNGKRRLWKLVGEGDVGGLGYRILYSKGTVICLIECPRCGKFGNLTVMEKRSYGRKYRIKHRNGDGRTESCNISYFDPSYDFVNEIYELFRRKKSEVRFVTSEEELPIVELP